MAEAYEKRGPGEWVVPLFHQVRSFSFGWSSSALGALFCTRHPIVTLTLSCNSCYSITTRGMYCGRILVVVVVFIKKEYPLTRESVARCIVAFGTSRSLLRGTRGILKTASSTFSCHRPFTQRCILFGIVLHGKNNKIPRATFWCVSYLSKLFLVGQARNCCASGLNSAPPCC